MIAKSLDERSVLRFRHLPEDILGRLALAAAQDVVRQTRLQTAFVMIDETTSVRCGTESDMRFKDIFTKQEVWYEKDCYGFSNGCGSFRNF